MRGKKELKKKHITMTNLEEQKPDAFAVKEES